MIPSLGCILEKGLTNGPVRLFIHERNDFHDRFNVTEKIRDISNTFGLSAGFVDENGLSASLTIEPTVEELFCECHLQTTHLL